MTKPLRVLPRVLTWGFKLLVGLICLMSLLSWLEAGLPESVLWLFSLTGHFRTQYFVILFAAIAGLMISLVFRWPDRKKVWLQALLLLPFLLINLCYLLPYYQPGPASGSVAHSKDTFRIFLVNLGPIQDFQLLLKAVQDTKPVMFCVVEHNQKLNRILSEPYWKEVFPYRGVLLNQDMGLYSQIPLSSFKIDAPSAQFGPSLITEFQWEHQPVTMVLAHPSVPVSPEAWQRQKNHFTHWIAEKGRYHSNLIILGDFNSVPWMPHFQRLLKSAGLRDSALGFGVQPSWFVSEPWAAVPIDHVLVSPGFQVRRRFIGPEIGSDHRPVLVDLAFDLR